MLHTIYCMYDLNEEVSFNYVFMYVFIYFWHSPVEMHFNVVSLYGVYI